MYKINIVCVGKLKEKHFTLAQDEYIKRLSKFCEIKILETSEFLLPQNPSENEIKNGLEKEYLQILPNLKGQVFVLDAKGLHFDSVEFSKKILKTFDNFDTITFVIGSSYGLSDKLKTNKNVLISFSNMTFPHHLIRVFLEEQIYRSFCILNNITYHK